MKKLLAVAFVSALAVSAMAVNTEESLSTVASSEGRKIETIKMDDVKPATAWWPAFFGVCEWPATPDLIGLRLTIPFSTRQECVTGIDLGLWGQCKDFEGIQLSILRNNVIDTFGGMQVGLYNSVSRGDCFGIQAGLWNEANSFRGLQVGLVNVAGDAQGFQVGVINRTDAFYGIQVGVINVIREAEVPVLPFINIGF